MSDLYEVPDGLKELETAIPAVMNLIVRTTRWVHPDTFHALPVWYPETARGMPIYDAKWTKKRTNQNRISGAIIERLEPNIFAGKALVAALGARKTPNWTVCHIWGVDDPTFQQSNAVVRDPSITPALETWSGYQRR